MSPQWDLVKLLLRDSKARNARIFVAKNAKNTSPTPTLGHFVRSWHVKPWLNGA